MATTRRIVTDSDGRESIASDCDICGSTGIAPNKGLGRAFIATWETRHVHPEAPK